MARGAAKMSRSIVGVISNLCTLLGIPLQKARGDNEAASSCSSATISIVARTLGIVARLIDIMDLTIDGLFVYELHVGGNEGWAVLMTIMMVLAHTLSCCYSRIVQSAQDRYGFSLRYMYYFGTNECIVFLLEDTTTIFLFAKVKGAFNKSHIVDVLNLVSTLASAGAVTVLVLLGGTRMLVRGTSADWIPTLAFTRLAHHVADTFHLPMGRVMNFLILGKMMWVAAAIGFFTYLVFGFVLSGRLIEGSTEVAATAVYCSSVALSLCLSFRLPWRKDDVLDSCGGECEGENEDDIGDIDLPLTSSREVV